MRPAPVLSWLAQQLDAPHATVELVQVSPRPYLRGGVALASFRACAPQQETIWAWALLADTESVCAAFLLDGPLDPRIKELCLAPLTTPEIALSYVRDLFPLSQGQTETEVMLDAARLEELLWYTPLLPQERKAVNELLLRHPTRVVASERAFSIHACMLSGTRLVRQTLVVSTGISSPLMPTRADEVGVISARSDEPEVLTSGLPSNYAIPACALPCRPTTDALALGERTSSTFAQVNAHEANAILADLNRRLGPPLEAPCLQRCWLACHGAYLLQVTALAYGQSVRQLVVWTPGIAHPLDQTLESLQALNRLFARHCGWSLIRCEQVADYLRFYFARLSSPTNPAFVLEPETTSALAEPTAGPEAETRAQLRRDLEGIAAPLRIWTQGAGTYRSGFSAHAVVVYGGEVHETRFVLSSEGDISVSSSRSLLCLVASRRTRAGRPTEELAFSPQAIPQPSLELPANEIRLQLEQTQPGQDLSIVDTTIWGHLRFEGQTVQCSLSFRRCRFRGEVWLRGLACAASVRFERCVFEDGLRLVGNRIADALWLGDCTFLGQGLVLDECSAAYVGLRHVYHQRSLSAKHLRSTGDLDILDCDIGEDLNLSGITVEGHVIIGRERRGCRIGASLLLTDARVDSVRVEGTRVGENLELDLGAIQKHIYVNECVIGEPEGRINLYHTVVQSGYTWLRSIQVGGDIYAKYLRVHTNFYMDSAGEPNLIRGSVHLANAEIGQVLRIRHSQLCGGVRAFGLCSSALRIGGGRALGDFRGAYSHRNSLPAVPVEHTLVGGELDLSYADIRHYAELCGLSATGGGQAPAHLSLRSAKIGGDLSLFMPEDQAKYHHFIARETHHPAGLVLCLAGGVDLSKAQIGGNVDLSHVQCQDGQLDLSDAHVARDIIIRCQSSAELATAAELCMTGLVCDGNADLTGLQLRPAVDAQGRRRAGHLLARGAHFQHQLRIASQGHSAILAGEIDLAETVIGRLSLSWGPTSAGLPTRVPVHLDRATIDKVTFFAAGHPLPYPLYLRHAVIRWWEFADAQGRRRDEAEDYIALLTADPELGREQWKRVESSLLRAGRTRAADRVHRSMRIWQLRELRGRALSSGLTARARAWAWLDWLWNGLWNSLTNHETSPFRLSMIVLLWTAISILLFAEPANLEPSEAALAATHTTLTGAETPDAQAWGAADGLWIAVRYHVPVVAFTAREGWVPTGSRRLHTDCCGILPFIAEDYANVVTAIHWILWPLILFIVSRKLLQRYEH